MRRVLVVRLLALIAIVVVAMGAGVAAYHFGVVNGPNTPMMGRYGFRGGPVAGAMGRSDWPGLGLLGILAVVVGGVLFIWLLAAILSPNRGRLGNGAPGVAAAASSAAFPPTAPQSGPAAGDVERLRELSDLHSAGRLTDEEFTAAKRKLLGM